MIKKEAQKRIEKLRKTINHHRYLYHVQDKQEISEAALDSLKKELFDLEQQFPELVTSDSPTQRVGGRPLEKFEKYEHKFPMLSFNDAFSKQDMEDWLQRISKLVSEEERKKIDFFCELKIDGLAIELVYKNGILETGSTRGDGKIGENVTQNLKTIEAIPLKIKKELPELIARSEAFISKKTFEKINEEQKKKGEPAYANPRNIAAGSIRQLDSKITAFRRLDSYAYDLISDLGQATHEEKHKILKILGFKINPHNKYCKNLKEVFEFYQNSQKLRGNLNYGIDGIVVFVNNNDIFEKLGIVGKTPRGAVAYKFPLQQATTIIENIRVQVGRTGALTPVAHLKPVQVGGVTISRATLHNEDEIKRLGVKIGDTVIVGRAGDVIPDVIKVLPELRTGKEKEFRIPPFCPVCCSRIIKLKGEVVSRCPNISCPARKREHFYHFTAKGAFNIVGLGPKIVDKLLDASLISDPADLFKLEVGDMISLESLPRRKPKAFLRGFAEKSAKNLVEAIHKSKEIDLARFVYSLGIRNAGEETARDLADFFSTQGGPQPKADEPRGQVSGWGSLEKLKNAEPQELEKVMDIGPVVAKSIYDWFRQKRNLIFLEKLQKAGIKIKGQKSGLKTQKLKGSVFVLTGGLETMTREEAKEKIRAFGGEVSESVSKNTNFVIVSKEPGSKLEKAKKLGVKIINEQEFLKMLK